MSRRVFITSIVCAGLLWLVNFLGMLVFPNSFISNLSLGILSGFGIYHVSVCIGKWIAGSKEKKGIDYDRGENCDYSWKDITTPEAIENIKKSGLDDFLKVLNVRMLKIDCGFKADLSTLPKSGRAAIMHIVSQIGYTYRMVSDTVLEVRY